MGSSQAGSGVGRSILLVEDEQLLAVMLQDLLHDAGYVVTHVDNLNHALEAVATERFDAAMLDINLGADEVYPVAEKLSASGVPFFFASARGAGGLSHAFRHHPIVPKPYRIDQIETMLEAALRGDLDPGDSGMGSGSGGMNGLPRRTRGPDNPRPPMH